MVLGSGPNILEGWSRVVEEIRYDISLGCGGKTDTDHSSLPVVSFLHFAHLSRHID